MPYIELRLEDHCSSENFAHNIVRGCLELRIEDEVLKVW